MSTKAPPNKRTKLKLKRYLKDDRYHKLKSFVKKHLLDVVNIRLENNDTALHVACSTGQRKTIRYLLKKHASLLATNDDNEVPLHMLCRFMLSSPSKECVETVQLILDKCSSALSVVNRWNITPQDLLERLEDKVKPIQIDGSDSSTGNDDEERVEEEWARRLAEEAGAEYDEHYGDYEQDYCDFNNYQEEQLPETYDEWADRLFAEHRTKRQAENEVHQPKKKHCNQEEPNKWKEYQEKLEKEHKEYLIRVKSKQRTNLIMAKQLYEAKCLKLFSSSELNTDNLCYDDIPWPFLPKKREKSGKEKVYGCVDKTSYDQKESLGLSNANIKEFLLSDIVGESAEVKLKYLKEQRVRWHPDRFAQRCGKRLNSSEKGTIKETVKNVSQAINTIVTELK